jgi:hypothetical protein
MYTQKNIIGLELYLVFECVYFEDGINPEYIFSGAFIDKDKAKDHFDSINNDFYKHSNKLFKQKMDITSDKEKLFWNLTNGLWTDCGCFMTVSNEQISDYLNNN